MATKRERIENNILAITEKVKQLQAKLESLQQERKKLLDMEILETVYSVQVTPEELKAVLSQIKKVPISSDIEQHKRREETVGETEKE